MSLVARLTLNKENDISIAPRILLASYMVVVGSLGTTPVLPPVSAVKPLAQIDNLISPPKTLTWDEQLAPQLARAEQQRVDEAARLQAIAAQAAAEAAEREIEAQAVRFTYRAPQTAYTALQSGELTGSLGYARAGGNCTMEPGVNNPWNGTNPIDWPILSETPTIGATVLFTYNHTGVITGLWSNGDIEIRHQNWNGAPQTRFPRSAFRGFR